MNWTYFTTGGANVFYVHLTDIMAVNGKVLCSKYKTTNETFTALSDKCISTNNSTFGTTAYLFVKDTTYTDTTAFKNANKGVLLAYEKA